METLIKVSEGCNKAIRPKHTSLCLVIIKFGQILDKAHRFAGLDSNDAYNGLRFCQNDTIVPVEQPTHTWKPKKKKLIFHLLPETQNLLMTVILIDDKQYARMEIDGLLVMLDGAAGTPMLGDLLSAGDARELFVGISMV